MKRVFLLAMVNFLLVCSCVNRHQKVISRVINNSGDYKAIVELSYSTITNPVYTQVYLKETHKEGNKELVFEMNGPNKVIIEWKNNKKLQVSYPTMEKASHIYRIYHKVNKAMGVKIIYDPQIVVTYPVSEEEEKKPPSVVYEGGK